MGNNPGIKCDFSRDLQTARDYDSILRLGDRIVIPSHDRKIGGLWGQG